jgi:hypothetical protein
MKSAKRVGLPVGEKPPKAGGILRSDDAATEVESSPSTEPEFAEEPPLSKWRPERFIKRINGHYAFLLLLPWILFSINPNWPFQGFGTMDPWYYFGMSIDFPRYEHLRMSYADERITWVLPARLFVALFSPAYGWMFFHIFLYSISTLCLYSLLRRLVGTRAALAAAAMMAVHPFFIGSNGWSYVESGCITYLLLSFVALAAARRSEASSFFLTLAGIFWAATAYNYFLYWLLTPCCAFFFWAVGDSSTTDGRADRRRYATALAWFVLGLAITTGLMAFANYCIYGWFSRFFYASTWAAATSQLVLKKGQNTWGMQSYDWIRTGGWILFPVLTFFAGVIAIVRHYFFRRIPRLHLGIVLTYCYAFLALAYLTMRENQILQFDYYASILIPLEFLVLGVLVFRTPPRLSGAVFGAVLLISAIISVAPLWRVGWYSFGVGPNLLKHYAFGLAAIVPAIIWRRSFTWAFAMIGLAAASFGLIPLYPSTAWTYSYNGLAAVKRVADAVMAIDENTPPDTLPVVWIDNFTDPYSAEYRSIMCAFQAHLLSMQRFPEVDPTKKYAPGTELILITRNRDAFPIANEGATRAGMPLRMRKQQLITGDGLLPGQRMSYWLTFTEVLSQPQVAAKAAE